MRVFHPRRFLDVDFRGVHTSRLAEDPKGEQKTQEAFTLQQTLTASAVLAFGIPSEQKPSHRADASEARWALETAPRPLLHPRRNLQILAKQVGQQDVFSASPFLPDSTSGSIPENKTS